MIFLSFLLPFGLAVAAPNLPHLLSDEYIELINTKQDSWKAGRNYPEDTPLEKLTGLLGTFQRSLHNLPFVIHSHEIIAALPESFDSREKWRNCPSLNEIRDQGICGSCWAFGAVEAMTDRWCIHTNGSQFHFSAQDMVGCSTSVNGCHGGYLETAWYYWFSHGLVSGGNYNSNEGCKPYELPECIHGNSGNANCTYDGIVNCVTKCRDGYEVSYREDKRYGLSPYRVRGEDDIRAELYRNGPLEAAFLACPDIFHYKNGVYKTTHPNDSDCEGHAVKIIGWGTENGTKYWLIANSWNTYWGELGGFFKFLRGEDHMGIESNVIGGLPNLSYQ